MRDAARSGWAAATVGMVAVGAAAAVFRKSARPMPRIAVSLMMSSGVGMPAL